jgi:predicted transcriptional regulator YdeE
MGALEKSTIKQFYHIAGVIVMTRKELAKTIQQIKKQWGWTYTDMSRLTGINRNQLNKYGTGLVMPKDLGEFLYRLSQANEAEVRKRMAKHKRELA